MNNFQLGKDSKINCNFDEIDDGFKNPAPPKPNCAEDVNTSNAG